MKDWLLVFLLVMATYRLTKFVAQDHFPPVWELRQWVLRKWPGTNGDMSWQGYLVQCMWCVSVYAGVLVVGVANIFVDMPYPWLIIPTASAITGLIATFTPED